MPSRSRRVSFDVPADAYDRFMGRYSVPLAPLFADFAAVAAGWWEPLTLGVGPAGAYAAGLDAERQGQLRQQCRDALPAAPFVLTARAWSARGLA